MKQKKLSVYKRYVAGKMVYPYTMGELF